MLGPPALGPTVAYVPRHWKNVVYTSARWRTPLCAEDNEVFFRGSTIWLAGLPASESFRPAGPRMLSVPSPQWKFSIIQYLTHSNTSLCHDPWFDHIVCPWWGWDDYSIPSSFEHHVISCFVNDCRMISWPFDTGYQRPATKTSVLKTLLIL